ncbi:MAG TPA: glycosyltransferase family 39 protein [Candidatus Acidoferrum sp.]|nr:glycosyltransferase family 39 protein [Candidatus Acidoferrum sp.]
MIISIILLSIAIQTAFFQFLPPALNRNENGDYFSFYGPVASNLETGNGLLDKRGDFAIYYPPGFPLVLAFQFKVAGILGVEPLSVIAVFNVLISAVSCACVFLIAENVFARRAALLAALAWATYPPNVWLSVQPNSEIPYLPLYFLSVLAALRAIKEMNPKLAVKAGVFVGLAALVRPIALTSAVFLAAGLVMFSPKEFRRRGFASGALLFGAFLLMTAPWELCVYAKTGRSLPMFAKGSSVVTQGLTSVITDAPGKPPTPGEVSRSKRGVVGVLIDQLKANPGPILKLLSLKLVRGWYGMYRSRRTNQILPVQLFYLLLAAIGLRRAIRDGRYNLPGIWLLLLSIAGAWLTTVVTVPLLRYMIPQMPLVLIFFAFAFDQLLFEPRRPVRPPIAA